MNHHIILFIISNTGIIILIGVSYQQTLQLNFNLF